MRKIALLLSILAFISISINVFGVAPGDFTWCATCQGGTVQSESGCSYCSATASGFTCSGRCDWTYMQLTCNVSGLSTCGCNAS